MEEEKVNLVNKRHIQTEQNEFDGKFYQGGKAIQKAPEIKPPDFNF